MSNTTPRDAIEVGSLAVVAPPTTDRAAFEPTRSLHNAASRTWELEMLISGAVLFGLFQLPGLLDTLQIQILPHVGARIGPLVFVAHLLGKIMVYTAISIFAIHLVARAYWVGLIGLDSVFPGGVRWDRTTYGPATMEVYRERMPSIPAVIARTDRFCSVLFSFGFLIVVSCLFALVGGLLAAAIDLAESRFLFGGREGTGVFPLLLVLLACLGLAIHFADRGFGSRLDPDGRPGRALRRAAALQFRLIAAPSYMLVFLTLVTNLPKRVVSATFYASVAALVAVVLAETAIDTGILRLGSTPHFPDAAVERSVTSRFYADQRSARDAYLLVPSIQSDVVEDPYVRLFIPYAPERLDAAIAAHCPEARPLNSGGVRVAPRGSTPEMEAAGAGVLQCLADIHRVAVNGTPVAELDLHFHTHPDTGLPGVLAYLATDGLPRGRNLLTVRQATVDEAAAAEPFRIPFWR